MRYINIYKNENKNFNDNTGNGRFEAQKIKKLLVLELVEKEKNFGKLNLFFGHTVGNAMI